MHAHEETAGALRLNATIAGGRLLLAAWRLQYAPKRNPSWRLQPRVPVGNSDGGQWTGSGSLAGDQETLVAQAESNGSFSVDLLEEEAAGGHTIRAHVGRSTESLLAVFDVKGLPLGRSCELASIVRALFHRLLLRTNWSTRRFLATALSWSRLLRVIAPTLLSKRPLAPKLVSRPYDADTIRSHIFAIPMALACIFCTRRTEGTAFESSQPIQETIEKNEVMKTPVEFQRMISLMHADIDLVLSPEDDVFQYLLGGVTASERPIVARFIDSLIGSNLNEKELVMKLVKAGADVFVNENDVVPFLTELRDRLRE